MDDMISCLHQFFNRVLLRKRNWEDKMKIKVTTVESELEFETNPKTTGRELYNFISRNIGVHETWWFGIYFKNADNENIWIDISKKHIKSFANYLQKLKFRIKFYPEDVELELIEDITIKFFFQEVKSYILSGKIYCPPDTCALLASYALQAKFGNYDSEQHQNGFLSSQNLLPERVIKQHNMERSAWEETITNMWQKHYGVAKEDAMLEYLKCVQKLEMFGVHYFNIKNRKGTALLLGVTPLGLNVYKESDKINPTIQFPWCEISKIDFRDTKFTIKPVDKMGKDFIFYSASAKLNKRIFNLGIGHYNLYIRRRKPETLEVTQMKAKAAEIKEQRKQQSTKLQAEINARKQAEKREKEYQQQIQAMKEEMERSLASLREAQETIKKLQEQLDELRKSKEELEHQQKELKEMLTRLEDTKNMEAAEKHKLEEEIRAKQLEVQRIQEEVELKDKETLRLQEQIEEAKKREEELRTASLKETIEVNVHTVEEKIDEESNLAEVNEQLREQLKLLQDKLEKTRDESQDTQMDIIHRQNIREGRDKYKTLADIRKGNTIRRVDLFENL